MEDNLKLWDSVKATDPKYLKKVKSGGREYSAIDAYYQMEVATKKFGSYGSSWGLRNIETNFLTIGNDTLGNLKAEFYYPDGKFDIINSIKVVYKTNGYQGKEGYMKSDEDWAKKIETNTISKALSKLGFNVDVFMGKFEDNEYVQELNYIHAKVSGAVIDTEKISELIVHLKKRGISVQSVVTSYSVNHLGQLTESQYKEILGN